jgi:hypothetical protein
MVLKIHIPDIYIPDELLGKAAETALPIPCVARSGSTDTFWLSDYSVRLLRLLCQFHVLLGRALLILSGYLITQ